MAEEQYILINKGHFELDAPERIEDFQRKLGLGPKPDQLKLKLY